MRGKRAWADSPASQNEVHRTPLRALYGEWVDGDESARQIVDRLAIAHVKDAPVGRFVEIAGGWAVERVLQAA